MTKRPNNGSRNQNAPTQDPMALLHGPIAGDSGHRREYIHALCSCNPRHQLQGEGRHAAFGQLLGGLGVGKRVAQSDDRLIASQQRQIRPALVRVHPQRADLQQAVGRRSLLSVRLKSVTKAR